MESRFESLWLDTSEKTTYPALQEDASTDVCIVGGGIAGLLAAYFLTQAGKRVVLLEANTIVSGTTGYTTAKVTALHDAKYTFLRRYFGDEQAKQYFDSNIWAIDELASIIKRHSIDCDFIRADAYLYTNEEKEFETLRKEQEALQAIGASSTLVKDLYTLPFPIKHALRLPNQATFHPRKFLLQLAKAITDAGGQICEHSRAESIEDGKPCVVKAGNAQVKAEDVIIATNYPIKDTNALFTHMGQMRSYAVAFPIEKSLGKEMYVGLGHDEFTVRTYSDKNTQYVILGGEDHPVGDKENTDAHYQRMIELAKEKFTITDIAYQWSAQDAAPYDRVPYIGQMPKTDHLYMTTGYGEWGMTTSVVSGRLLKDLITKQPNKWEKLYSPARLNVLGSLSKSLEMGKEVVKGFASYLTRHDDPDLSNMKDGEGRIIDTNGEKVAVYKDEHKGLCPLSAVCTHLGCIVEFNSAERTWDCPCHGSRFTTQGGVIHGPAVKPLEKRSL